MWSAFNKCHKVSASSFVEGQWIASCVLSLKDAIVVLYHRACASRKRPLRNAPESDCGGIPSQGLGVALSVKTWRVALNGLSLTVRPKLWRNLKLRAPQRSVQPPGDIWRYVGQPSQQAFQKKTRALSESSTIEDFDVIKRP